MTEKPDNLARAVAALAAEDGLDPVAIEVIAYEHVTWRDGSIGCPQPGMFYTQALVEGYRIHLRAEGADVYFHGATGQAPFRCGNPDPQGDLPVGRRH
jgi:hypothetical protein